MKCARSLGREGVGNMNPAGSIPSVLGKQRMQGAEEIVNFPLFHFGKWD